MNESSKNQTNNLPIKRYLKKLELRITRIEDHLNLKPIETESEIDSIPFTPDNIEETVNNLEMRIGQYWFAKVGIVLLAIGIVFLLTLPYKGLPSFIPSLIGYSLVAGILTISYLWRKSFSFISSYLLGGGLVLLYFATLRLYFFSSQPVVANKFILVLLLMTVVLFSLILSIRRNSVYLSSLILTLGYIVAIIAGKAIPLFSILTIMSILTVYFYLKKKWNGLFIYGILLTYFIHFIWFINNPFLGNRIQFVSSPEINIYFILLYIVIFSLGNLLRSKETPENNTVISSTFFNSINAFGLYLLITASKFTEHLFLFHILATIIFLILSITFWIKEKSKFSTFFYAITGYSALSIAIIVQFKSPEFFIWLSWQSLLVITTALWFRSKIIVVTNFGIFLIIFLAYIFLAADKGIISLSFGIVALLSARIMNWQKHRLELKTELMRNSYLATAFVAVPYALYHSIPNQYLSLSWVALAVFYYVLSLTLKNKKYRWMALLTLLLSVIYILIIGIIKLTPVFRIISFIVLGLVLLIISLTYTKIKTKTNPDQISEN